MKKFINKNTLFSFILGGILFSVVGVSANYLYQANQISYTPSDTTWNATNINEALNELYAKSISSNNEIEKVYSSCSMGSLGTWTSPYKLTYTTTKAYDQLLVAKTANRVFEGYYMHIGDLTNSLYKNVASGTSYSSEISYDGSYSFYPFVCLAVYEIK